MSFTEAIQTVLSKYATFSGRASRPEFWWWMLFVVLLSIATGIVDAAFIAPKLGFEPYEDLASQPLSSLVGLALLLPNISVAVRRLHDIDRSGWWYLVILIPIIGIFVYIYWAVQPGTSGSNRFGV